MKRLLLLLSIILFSFSSSAQYSFDTVWVKTNDDENAPEWFSTGEEPSNLPGGDPSFGAVERGIAYNPVTNHIYVSSRHAEDLDGDDDYCGEPHIYILDPLSGEPPTGFGAVDRLLTSNINSLHPENFGGGYPLNNVVVDDDGAIYACNMTLASGPDIVGTDGAITVKAFRVWRWDWEAADPVAPIIDYQGNDPSYRLGDKFSVFGVFGEQAYVYAVPGDDTKMLRWSITGGVVASEPEIITLTDIEGVGSSATVANVPGQPDWLYVSGKGLYPTLFTTGGENFTKISITAQDNSLLAGRTLDIGGGNYLMAMFAGNQSAFVIDLSKHGENVTDADIVGYTPTIGTRYDNAYGEGAVDIAVIDKEVYVWMVAPSNGMACFKVNGITLEVEKLITNEFEPSIYPNPVGDEAKLRFTLPGNARGIVAVKTFDLSGRFLGIHAAQATGGTQEVDVPTSHIPAGAYAYQVVWNNRISVGKFIKK